MIPPGAEPPEPPISEDTPFCSSSPSSPPYDLITEGIAYLANYKPVMASREPQKIKCDNDKSPGGGCTTLWDKGGSNGGAKIDMCGGPSEPNTWAAPSCINASIVSTFIRDNCTYNDTSVVPSGVLRAGGQMWARAKDTMEPNMNNLAPPYYVTFSQWNGKAD